MPRFNVLYLLSLLLFSTSVFAEDSTTAFQASADRGKATFTSLCSHCHYMTHEVSAVGCPGLQDVLSRHDAVWLDSWLTSPEKFAETNDKAKKVVAANPYGLVMPTLPEMATEHKRQDIIAFLKTLK